MFYQFDHFGTSEYFFKDYESNYSFPLHMHRSFEFLAVLEGEMEVTVDKKVYKLHGNECVLIFPNQPHSLLSQKSKHMLCIFSTELVKAYSSKIAEKIPTENIYYPDKFLINALNDTLTDASVIQKKAILYFLCSEFDKNAQYQNRTNFDDNLLYQIFKFVELNFSKDCSLNRLAESTGYSYSYLSRCFKKVTGISYNAYVNQYRINNACYLLTNSDYSILQCALDSGYDSLRSFNRNFTEYLSVTPSEYRKNNTRV